MKRYSEDDRGRVFRWDGQLEQWHRIMSYDEEYEAAVRSLRDAADADGRTSVATDAIRMPAQRPSTAEPTADASSGSGGDPR